VPATVPQGFEAFSGKDTAFGHVRSVICKY
jgi:hypothetical protein